MSENAKMHELLAVESDLQKKFLDVAKESKDTFGKKAEHFRGHVKTLKMKSEDRVFEEAAAAEHKEVVSTVAEKLDYTAKTAVKYFDALLQKELTNQNAVADLVIDGKTVAKDLPATYLLAMESRLKVVREYYAAIPTLAPGVSWTKDDNQREGILVTEHPDVREKTEKEVVFQTVAEATEQHPAQISQQQQVKVVGLFTTKIWCGMVTPGEKSDLLARVDKLYQGFKQARSRANQVEVVTAKIGRELFRFISTGEVSDLK
ncbi:MAG: hypothetical protein U9Q07_04345 [Planctomycetota bacterium]|nr:hypothetical protein [Planctomycetota bacterium]